MKKIFQIHNLFGWPLAIMVTLFLASCHDNWIYVDKSEIIPIEANGIALKPGKEVGEWVANIEAGGGEFMLFPSDAKKFRWMGVFVSIKEGDGEFKSNPEWEAEREEWIYGLPKWEGEWGTAKNINNYTVKINILPNTTGKVRVFRFALRQAMDYATVFVTQPPLLSDK